MPLTRPQSTDAAHLLQALTQTIDRIESYEPWHLVDTAGEPAFKGSWVNFDANRPARFRKDAMGFVHLDGLVKSGVIGTVAYTLPQGYCPDHPGADQRFAVDSNSAFGVVSVDVSGDVTPVVGNTAWVSLAGITFRAAV